MYDVCLAFLQLGHIYIQVCNFAHSGFEIAYIRPGHRSHRFGVNKILFNLSSFCPLFY